MKTHAIKNSAPLSGEEQLLDYAQRLKRHRKGRRGLLVRLSRLSRLYRQPHHLRAAREPFARLLRQHEGQLFTLGNDDFVCVVHGAPRAALDRALFAVQLMVRDDPAMKQAIEKGEEAAFLGYHFDIETDYASFLAFARGLAAGRSPEELLAGAVRREEDGSREESEDGESDGGRQADAAAGDGSPDFDAMPRGRDPDLDTAQGLLRALQRIDVAPFVCERPVELHAGEGRPRTVMRRIAFDIADLRRRLAPAEALPAGAPIRLAIERYLAEKLTDLPEHPLAGEEKEGLATLVDTSLWALDLPTFRAWLRHLRESRRRHLVMTLPAAEVLAAPDRYRAERRRLAGAGVRLAVRDLAPELASLFGGSGLPAAFLLLDAAALPEDEGAQVRSELRRQLAALDPARLIWCGPDDEATMRRGLDLGIRLFCLAAAD